MNQILVATIIAVSIIGAGAYAASQVSEMSAASSMSSDIDIEKKSENMNVFFNGSINIINTGKDPSEIAMFRFYDSSGIKVHQVMISDDSGRTFGATSQVSNSLLTSDDAHLPRHTTQSFSLVELGIESLEDITGELVTKRGRTFPISFDERTNQNGVGTGVGTGGEDGTAVLDAIGVSLNIHNIITDGTVYFGNGFTGLQTAIRPYVGVNQNDDWAIAISDDDKIDAVVLDVPEFAKKYRFNGNKLVDVTEDAPNVLWYYDKKFMSGSPNVRMNHDGITISGTGTVMMKLYSYSDGLWFRGALNNADVKIVTSPLDLSRISMSGNNFVLYDNTSPSISLTHTVEIPYTVSNCGQNCDRSRIEIVDHYLVTSNPNIIVASGSDLRGAYDYDLVYYYKDHSCAGKNSPGCFKWVAFSVVGSLNAVVSSRSTGDDLLVTSSSTSFVWSSRFGGPDPGSWSEPDGGPDQGIGTRTHTLLSTAPWNEQYSFDSNFEQYIELPYDSYLVANLNDGNVVIKGENFNPDAFFQVKGLPSHVAYDISKNGITGVIGKTSGAGEISLSRDDVDFGIATSPGGDLKIYPDSVLYRGYLGSALIDMYNKESIPLNIGNDLVYIPQNYVRWIFPVAVDVTNVRVDNIQLDYLDGNYAKNGALVIPVIPSADTIYATINGIDIEVLMRDVSVYSQIKQVLKKSSTSSDHSTSGTVSTSSNIATSTFLTATHTGTAIANIDIKVGGSAEFSMDSNYVGGFTTTKRCNAYSSNNPGNQCTVRTAPNNPDAISNIDSLTSAHQLQLETALDNGQLSQITVEVDIFKNLQYVKTKLIYTSTSSQAFLTSTLSEAGYGASNQVHVMYPLTSTTDNITIPVTVGDMIEFVVRVNLEASGAPTPSYVDSSYSSYVKTTTEFGGGIITVGIS